MKQSLKIEIAPKSILVAIATIILFLVAWRVREVLISLFVAFILMSGSAPLVDFLVEKGTNRVLAVAITYILAIGLFALLIFSIVPPLVDQINGLVAKLPDYYKNAVDMLQSGQLSVLTNENIVSLLSSRVTGALSNFLSVVLNIVGVFISFITIAVFTFYMLLERQKIKENIHVIFPGVEKKRVVELADKIEEKVGAWVRGQLVLMLLVGVTTYIALLILGVPYALPLAIVAGLLKAVPVIGPIIAAIPAILVAFVHSAVLAIAVLALYLLVEQITDNFISPLLMAKAVDLSPLVIIFALLVGGMLFGIVGALLAVPAAGIVQVIFEDYLKNKAEAS
jgi:predicted PurR-regulated permease PerM